jgi:hypothetical protein
MKDVKMGLDYNGIQRNMCIMDNFARIKEKELGL